MTSLPIIPIPKKIIYKLRTTITIIINNNNSNNKNNNNYKYNNNKNYFYPLCDIALHLDVRFE